MWYEDLFVDILILLTAPFTITASFLAMILGNIILFLQGFQGLIDFGALFDMLFGWAF